MKKKVAKIFREHGGKKILIIRRYTPVGAKGKTTAAIACARREFNKTLGAIMLNGTKEEIKLVAKTMQGDLYEDWDSETQTVIKY